MSSDDRAAEERRTQLRALERRLRRDKRALEQLNPLVDAAGYLGALEHLADMEAQRRDLRVALTDPDVDDEPPLVWGGDAEG